MSRHCLQQALRPFLIAVALLGPTVITTRASADSAAPSAADKARAKKALERGQKLYSQGKLEEAISAFRASHEIVADPKATLMIARCQRDSGELLKAHDTYKSALDEAEAASARGDVRRATMDEIRKDLRDLDGVLGWVSIELAHAPSGTRVTVDGRDVTGQLGGPIRVAPGPLVVVATAPGGAEKSQKISVKAGETSNVELSFTWSGPSDEALANQPEEGGARPTEDEPETTTKHASHGKKTWVWVAGGVGVAGLATFGVFGLMSNAKFGKLEDSCVDGHCPPELEDDQSAGKTYQTIANVGLVVGAVGVGTAITLLALGGPSDAAYSARSGTPRLRIGLGSVSLSGSFR